MRIRATHAFTISLGGRIWIQWQQSKSRASRASGDQLMRLCSALPAPRHTVYQTNKNFDAICWSTLGMAKRKSNRGAGFKI